MHLILHASKNSDGLSEEELKERGLNYSLTHVDFMIGDEHMNIKGYTRDGQEVDIMIDGHVYKYKHDCSVIRYIG